MDSKPKRRVVRRRAITPISDMEEGASPVPAGLMSDPECGHGGCGHQCNVHYVGPTSPIRDHHIMHAAKGVTHIWGATIVTGLALVLTGAIAYNAVEAKTELKAAAAVKQGTTRADWVRIMNRLDQMDRALNDVKVFCNNASTTQTTPKVVPQERKNTTTTNEDATSTR